MRVTLVPAPVPSSRTNIRLSRRLDMPRSHVPESNTHLPREVDESRQTAAMRNPDKSYGMSEMGRSAATSQLIDQQSKSFGKLDCMSKRRFSNVIPGHKVRDDDAYDEVSRRGKRSLND